MAWVCCWKNSLPSACCVWYCPTWTNQSPKWHKIDFSVQIWANK